MSSPVSSFAPIAATTGAPVALAMQRLWLAGQILPAGARLVVQHVFQSAEERPIEAIYAFPLPRDAALRRFRITGDGFETTSELKETGEAVKDYERGIADGSLAVLARQYGDGVINLTVGNIRPKEKVTVHLELLAGVELRDGGFRFRFPFTLAPAYHPGMRVAAEGGEGEIELPAGEFGDVILPPFRQNASSLHQIGFELSVLHQLSIEEIGSPSHAIRIKQTASEPARITLAPEQDVPNRDLVLDVDWQEKRAQVLAGPDGAGKRSFSIVVPSIVFGETPRTPRRMAILLDRSGSMQGEPITQACKAIEACLAALEEQDTFGVFAFDDRVEAMQPALAPATREHRERARAFLQQVHARGGTQLAEGVKQAAAALEGAGDIIILTDGQVAGTEAILAQARATGIRLSCLGIGSASQDRFLSVLARETGGVSRFVTPRERVDLAAVGLFASLGRPVASGVKASGVEPEPPHTVFGGTPLLLFGELDGGSGDRVTLHWDGGTQSFDIPAGDAATGETVRLLRGSRLITDWESRYPSQEALAPLEKRKQGRVANRLMDLSRTFELASREMSLVAVVRRSGDRPGELPETRVVPVGMAQDTAFSAYFHPSAPAFSRALQSPGPLLSASDTISMSALREGVKFRFATSAMGHVTTPPPPPPDVSLIELAAMLEPDGGLPGDSAEVRAARTVAAVFALAAEKHTEKSGAFRLHVQRLVAFLKSTAVARPIVERALKVASGGKAPKGQWLKLALDPGTQWKQVEKELS